MKKLLFLASLISCSLTLYAADSSKEHKNNLLCFEAKKWVGVKEEGANSGQLIKIFQRACDNKAEQEPWCMAFVQYCIKMTDEVYAVIFPDEPPSSIYRSEHC